MLAEKPNKILSENQKIAHEANFLPIHFDKNAKRVLFCCNVVRQVREQVQQERSKTQRQPPGRLLTWD